MDSEAGEKRYAPLIDLTTALRRGIDMSICHKCATSNSAKWPKGHCASMWTGTCAICSNETSVCALSDWQWPKARGNKLDREV